MRNLRTLRQVTLNPDLIPLDTSTTRGPEDTQLSAAALAEWSGHVDGVLRGIAHALNNRAASLSAVMELAREPAEEGGAITTLLSIELQRIGDLAAVVGAIGAPRRGAEAFTPADAAADAARVLSVHSGLREPRATFEAASAGPVRGERWMFVRALIALASDAERVTIVDDRDWVVARAHGGDATRSTTLLEELSRLMEGETLDDGQRGFRVPSLASLRRREGR